MSHGSKSGTKKLLQMLPGLRSEEDSGVDFRLLLHQRTRQLKAAYETPLHFGYYLPHFTDKCFGCGRCEKACRAGALKLEDMPDGQTRMVVTPWKCSECGVCVAACSNSGLDGLTLRQLTTLGPVSVHKCTKVLCSSCGKPIAPGAEGIRGLQISNAIHLSSWLNGEWVNIPVDGELFLEKLQEHCKEPVTK